MTLVQLEYIVALARYRHFSEAAEACGVTQPTLSAMIGKLEDELGVKIFNRRRQPVTPTPEGQKIIAQAHDVLVQARRIRELADEQKRSLSGTFRIGILPTVAPYLLPLFYPQLLNAHPGLDLRMAEMKTADIAIALQHGDLDAGIVADVDGLSGLDKRPLYRERFLAYVAANNPLAAKATIKTSDLRTEDLWLLDEGHCFADQMVKFCHLKGASLSRRAYTLGNIETFMRIVEQGRGITFIPELALLPLNEQQRRLVHPFALPEPTRLIEWVTAPGFIRHQLAQFIGESIKGAVPQEMVRRI